MSQDITMPTLFGDICLSVKGVAKYNKNRTLEQNIALDWEQVQKNSLLLNNYQNDIKVGEQTSTEEGESVNATVELCGAEQETTQEPYQNQMQEEGVGMICRLLQSIENEVIEIPSI